MKSLPTILILALAFIHGVNAGKISGTMDSTEDEPMPPMQIPANGAGDGLMPIPVDTEDGILDRKLLPFARH